MRQLPGPTSLGLSERTERVLAYSVFWVSGLIFLLAERHPRVRRHAAQSVVVFGWLSATLVALALLGWVFGLFGGIPLIGFLFSLVGSIFGVLFTLASWLTILLWIWLMVQAYRDPDYHLPIPARLAGRRF
jgi:uncharacterized membrane protein